MGGNWLRKSAMKKRRSIREARYLEEAPHMATAPSPEEPGIKRMEKVKEVTRAGVTRQYASVDARHVPA